MTAGSDIIAWLGTATGVTPQPPPAPSTLSTTDSRCLLFEDPDLTAAQHAASTPGSRCMIFCPRDAGFGAQNQTWSSQANSKAIVNSSGDTGMERIRGCPLDSLRMYHMVTVAENYPRYTGNNSQRVDINDQGFLVSRANLDFWWAGSFVLHNGMVKLPSGNGPGFWDMHHTNTPALNQTPASVQLRGGGNAATVGGLNIVLRTNTKVETNGAWTLGPIDAGPVYTFNQNLLSGLLDDSAELKLVINMRTGYLQAQQPKFRMWAKKGATWLGTPAGAAIIDISDRPIGYYQTNLAHQIRLHHLYNWRAGQDMATAYPTTINNIPRAGLKGLRYWSRGSGIWANAAPAAGEPILNELVLMGWLERPALV